MKIIFSNHQLSALESCRRAEAFRFTVGLRKNVQKNIFIIGSLTHAGLAHHYMGKDWSDGLEEGVQEYDAPKDVLETSRLEASRLLKFYVENSKPLDGQDRLSPLAVENKFNVPLPPADNVELVGIIDLIANGAYGGSKPSLGIMDHKTAASCGNSYFFGSEYDSQYLLYAHAARHLGLSVEWFAWNVIVKTKEPRIVRHWLPINWHRVDSYIQRLSSFGLSLQSLPDTIDEALELPGNPAHCRRCPFRDLCDYPRDAQWLADNGFHKADYREFYGED